MPVPQLKVIRHRPPKYIRDRKKKKYTVWIKKLIKLGFVAFLLLVIYLVGAFAWYSRSLPDPSKLLDRDVAQSTKIYDRTGEEILYDIHGTEKRTLVQLTEIPEHMKQATIAAEDKYFYEHKGFNIFAMFKGVVLNPLRGQRARGGSTLTQQFVKNSILTSERRVSRKIKELVLSYKIEKAFSKDEILQMYLNEIPYGSVAYGVQSASRTFFQKDVDEISVAEAAILAALPKAPTFYSPYGSNTDRLFVRQQYVIDQMVGQGYLTEAEAEQAKAEDIKFAVKREAITAPHFVMYIKEILSDKLGDDLVERGGLKVITTLDLDKQDAAEEAVVAGVDARGVNYGFHNAALISLDARNGQILAMVGAKDYFDLENDGNVNVTLRLRQPGSSIKPMIYAAAFKKGYTPNTILYDVNTTFHTETKDYSPKNYDLSENGPVTIRKALAGSLNIPAVKAIYLTGVQKVVDSLELLGYTSFEDRSRFGLALVLGGGEVRMIEHAAGFAAFANQGVYNVPTGILKVEDSKGNVLMEFDQRDRKVLDSKVANLISNILSDNNARAYAFGAQNYLTLGGRPVAAKTGTTNNYRDAWTMGYTPSLVTGVWVGNNDNTAMKTGAAGGVVAAPIWNAYMNKALAGTASEGFPGVEIAHTGKSILDGAIAEGTTVKVDKITGKLATDETPPELIEEKQFMNTHSILHFVYKDDPRGGVPDDPAKADRAYDSWEAGIQNWLERKQGESEGDDMVFDLPPTEFDDVHTEANKPAIHMNNPSNGAVISGTTLSASVNVSAPRGISRVEYYLDEKRLQTVTAPPYSLNYPISSYFMTGKHRLRAIAFDDVDNKKEASANIRVDAVISVPTMNWLSPADGANISQGSFPIKLTARLTDLLASHKVNFKQRNMSGGVEKNIATIIFPESNNVTIDWNITEAGTYQLHAEIVDPNGKKYLSPFLTVNVN
jgi:1A family penicillin-binding protein